MVDPRVGRVMFSTFHANSLLARSSSGGSAAAGGRRITGSEGSCMSHLRRISGRFHRVVLQLVPDEAKARNADLCLGVVEERGAATERPFVAVGLSSHRCEPATSTLVRSP